MSLLLHAPHFTSTHRQSFQSPSSIQFTPLFTLQFKSPRRSFLIRVIDPSSATKIPDEVKEKDPNLALNELEKDKIEDDNGTLVSEDYPSGEFEYREFDGWKKFVVKLRMLIAYPWERVRKGSVLTMKLRGQISDQLKSRFASGISLPQICENFVKAAYDPRISGIFLHIEPLECGWGKVEEIRRHMLDFKKSGKFLVGYVPVCGEKEYYLACACEELYAPPSAYFQLYGLTVQSSFLGGNMGD